MKVQDILKSGKRGNVVAYKGRYGQVERQHVPPRKRQSAAQVRAANDFGRASARWNRLTDEQRDAWRERGKKTRTHPRGGSCGSMTGQNLETAINRQQDFIGLDAFLYPPDRPALGPCPAVRLRIIQDGGAIAIKLTLPKAFDGHILLFGSAALSAGRQYCDKFRYLTALQADAAPEADITQSYLARFVKPRPGSRIFIRAVRQENGWRGIPTRTSAIVPAT